MPNPAADSHSPPPPHILAAAHPSNRYSIFVTAFRSRHYDYFALRRRCRRRRCNWSWSSTTRSGRTARMLSSRTYRTTATVGRMSQRLHVTSTLGSLRNVFLGPHRRTGIRNAQNGLRERKARTATVCLAKRKTSEGNRLAYSAMTPSRSGMRTGTLLRPRQSPSTPARIGGPSPLALALGWCSTTEGRAVLPGTPKPWPKKKTTL